MKLDLNLIERLVRYGSAVRGWAHGSVWKSLLVWGVVNLLLGAATVIGMQWLLSQQSSEGAHWRLELALKTRESILQLAADRISDCIKARGETKTQQQWYCEQAIIEYRKASEGFQPQQYVDDVVQRRAFLAMRSDVAHNIRSVDLQRWNWGRNEDAENQLRFVLSSKGVAIWSGLTSLVLGLTAAVLWLPQRRKAVVRKVKVGGAGARTSARR